MILGYLLSQSGFCDIERVGNFHVLEDTSSMKFKDYFVSLNMIAKKCMTENTNPDDVIEVKHSASPYDKSRGY